MAGSYAKKLQMLITVLHSGIYTWGNFHGLVGSEHYAEKTFTECSLAKATGTKLKKFHGEKSHGWLSNSENFLLSRIMIMIPFSSP